MNGKASCYIDGRSGKLMGLNLIAENQLQKTKAIEIMEDIS